MARGMTRQGDEFHAVDDFVVPLSVRHLLALMYGAAMACALWKNGCASFGAFSAMSGDNQKSLSAFATYTSALETRACRPGWSTADVIGMEVRDQHDVDFFRRVAGAAEAPRQAPECTPTPPRAGAHIDEKALLAGIDEKARISNV